MRPRPAAEAKADAESDPNVAALKEKGLVKSGNGFVLAGEAEVLEQMKALRLVRKQAEREALQRKKAEDKIAANRSSSARASRNTRSRRSACPRCEGRATAQPHRPPDERAGRG